MRESHLSKFNIYFWKRSVNMEIKRNFVNLIKGSTTKQKIASIIVTGEKLNASS